jgi:hypothetical protein
VSQRRWSLGRTCDGISVGRAAPHRTTVCRRLCCADSNAAILAAWIGSSALAASPFMQASSNALNRDLTSQMVHVFMDISEVNERTDEVVAHVRNVPPKWVDQSPGRLLGFLAFEKARQTKCITKVVTHSCCLRPSVRPHFDHAPFNVRYFK